MKISKYIGYNGFGYIDIEYNDIGYIVLTLKTAIFFDIGYNGILLNDIKYIVLTLKTAIILSESSFNSESNCR